jgi:hypothetical protein
MLNVEWRPLNVFLRIRVWFAATDAGLWLPPRTNIGQQTRAGPVRQTVLQCGGRRFGSEAEDCDPKIPRAICTVVCQQAQERHSGALASLITKGCK